MNRNIFSSLDGVDPVLYVTDVREKLINNELIDIILKKIFQLFLLLIKDLNDKFDLNNIEKPFKKKSLYRVEINRCWENQKITFR